MVRFGNIFFHSRIPYHPAVKTREETKASFQHRQSHPSNPWRSYHTGIPLFRILCIEWRSNTLTSDSKRHLMWIVWHESTLSLHKFTDMICYTQILFFIYTLQQDLVVIFIWPFAVDCQQLRHANVIFYRKQSHLYMYIWTDWMGPKVFVCCDARITDVCLHQNELFVHFNEKDVL